MPCHPSFPELSEYTQSPDNEATILGQILADHPSIQSFAYVLVTEHPDLAKELFMELEYFREQDAF
jgi:hypothetical protein